MDDSLDLDDVRAFVLTAEQSSFTRAADLLDTAQSGVSTRVKRLEAAVGRRLLDRTPRQVRLSPDGARFLDAARALLASHDVARNALRVARTRFVIGVSHHMVGETLPATLKAAAQADPGVVLDIRIASTRNTLESYDAGELDAAFALDLAADRRDGIALTDARFAWIAAPDFTWTGDTDLPLATQPAPCTVRSMATDALDQAGIAWTEAFAGGGTATIGAAASAGLGVAAMIRQAIPAGAVDVGARLGLPPLRRCRIVMHSRTADAALRARFLRLGEFLFRP